MSTRDGLGTRFLLSEVGMLLGRRRNQLILLVLVAVPVLIGIAVKLSSHSGEVDTVGGLIAGITDNGIFVAFTALVVVTPLLLPLAVAVVVGESIAGEANLGTLRYLLAAPIGRTRLLTAKFVALAVWCSAITAVVAVAGLGIGFALFPIGDVTLLSGTQTSITGGLGRLVVVVGYTTVMMLALGSVGLFISTLTDVPIAAVAATLAAAILMQVLSAVPQLGSLRTLMISHYWFRLGDMLRDPLMFDGITNGLFVAFSYIAISCSLAWARFTTKDITS
jgi:ABC-2 type transport system permease protein